MTCKTCKYLDVKPNRAGKIVPRASHAYPCRCPIPDLTEILPDSVLRSGRFPKGFPTLWMLPNDGEDCATYERRT